MIEANSQRVSGELRVVGYCHIDVTDELKPYTKSVLKNELLAIFNALNKIDPDIVNDAMGEFISTLIERS